MTKSFLDLAKSPSKSTATAIDSLEKTVAGIETQPRDSSTFSSTHEAFDEAVSAFTDVLSPLDLLASVYPDKKVQDEAIECKTKMRHALLELGFREKLFEVLNLHPGKTPIEKRLAEENLRSFRLNGLGRPDRTSVEKIRNLRRELTEIEAAFSKNLDQDQTTVEFKASDLQGVPADAMARFERAPNGNLKVTLKPTDTIAVMENAKNPESRKTLLQASSRLQAEKNVPLLEKAIGLRNEIASQLGFKNWVEVQLQGRMAPSLDEVLSFLKGLRRDLTQRFEAEQNQLMEFKRTLDPQADKIDPWDVAFIETQIRKRDHDLDDEEIRSYFPSGKVVETMLDLYSKLLGVQFKKIEKSPVWAEGVEHFAVFEGKTELATFYLDLWPRPGKYNHFAAFGISQGRKTKSGYHAPVAAIVGNFEPPTTDKPSLLNHSEVETLFHEFGHILHGILTRVPYGSLAGNSVAWDFVEVPSQLFENWVWDAKILASVAPDLPKSLLDRMLAARKFMQASDVVRQVFYSLLDLEFHTSGASPNTTAIYHRLYREILGREPVAGGQPQASFGHLMGGYDAGYYSYLWALVYADDLYTRFQKEGPLNPKTGQDLRQSVLSQGNLKDGGALSTDFLGRAPSNHAFLEKLGIQ